MNFVQSATRKQKPPSHLTAASKRWWLSVVNSYELDEHHVKLLTLAAEALDRAEECRKTIEKDGMLIDSPHGKKQHPLLAVERDSRLVYARLLKQLNLSDDDNHDRPGRGRK